jgi:hypothetical protein
MRCSFAVMATSWTFCCRPEPPAFHKFARTCHAMSMFHHPNTYWHGDTFSCLPPSRDIYICGILPFSFRPLFTAPGSWIELYSVALTLDTTFSSCTHRDYGSSHKISDVTCVPASSSCFQKALTSISQSSLARHHISIGHH